MKKFLCKLKNVMLFSISALVLPLKASAGRIPECTPGLGTVRNLLATAMQPVGQTLYIWGGGWNDDDVVAGKSAKHIGVWPQWKEFFDSQDSSYDFCDYAISEDGEAKVSIPEYLPLGLDCAGYRGWILYNVFHNQDMEGIGYVFPHARRVSSLVDNNWGIAVDPEDIKNFTPGDIMDKPGHVYMVVGPCSDGSVVFVHSSPPGVHICGTVTPDGSEQSEAVALAAEYMAKYYPEYNERYSHHGYMRDIDYLTKYTQVRWNTDESMKDPDSYTKMNAEQVLKNLFGEE